ncbi:hypothetical protein [Pedobacter sp. SYSU D00535]|uniref:hypothetical protein n=1 Tax=Pedobacter sp. SYSU D00535 TaxID=2810308 RepID=UPI001A95AA28|nr:hypothetical protein [Pedobacter sp. SYSU D00535]
MKTLKSTVVDLLREEECIDVEFSSFMNHIVVKLNDDDFERGSLEIERKIKQCINRRLPHRTEDILFDILSEDKETTFLLPKQLP